MHSKCLIHTWYLSADTQLYILAPFVVQLIFFFKFKAIFALTLSIIGCIVWTIGTYIKTDLTLVLVSGDFNLGKYKILNKMRIFFVFSDFHRRFFATYIPTHARFMPWLIGIFLGYILYKMRNKKIRIPTVSGSRSIIMEFSFHLSITLFSAQNRSTIHWDGSFQYRCW